MSQYYKAPEESEICNDMRALFDKAREYDEKSEELAIELVGDENYKGFARSSFCLGGGLSRVCVANINRLPGWVRCGEHKGHKLFRPHGNSKKLNEQINALPTVDKFSFYDLIGIVLEGDISLTHFFYNNEFFLHVKSGIMENTPLVEIKGSEYYGAIEALEAANKQKEVQP